MRCGLAIAAAASLVLALAVPAQAQAPGTVDDFAKLCPAAVLDRTQLTAARKETGLNRIDNEPLAFNWGIATFLAKDAARSAAVTTQKYADADRKTCVVVLDRALKYDEAVALRQVLEANALIGALDGKVYPSGSSVQAVLKRPGLDPLLTVTVGLDDGHSVLTLDSWLSRAP